MKIKFFLDGGHVVDWKIPSLEGFSFPFLMKNIRADGHFVTVEGVYIKAESIIAALLDVDETAQILPFKPDYSGGMPKQ